MILTLEPPDFLRDPALQAVLAALPEARLVGGCVRDAVAGVPVADIDLATPQPPDQVLAALHAAGLRGVPTGIAHGTVTAVSAGRGFEVTTLRRDLRTDGRHAEVAFSDDWQEDAARRDFTFNALSMTRDGQVYDPFGGIADLRAGRVRFVGDPATRLAEDRLRVLRFFRFYARYAVFPPEPETLAALRNAVPDLGRLSAERVWAELKRLLATPDPRAALTLMHQIGVLQPVLPEAGEAARLDVLIEPGAPPDPILRLAALLRPDAPSPAARLRFSTAETAWLDAMRQPAPAPSPADDDNALRRLLADTPTDVLIARSWLAGAPPDLRARLAAMPRPRFPLAGRDAVALGLRPGPAVGAALARVRAWWLAGGCTADRVACRTRLAKEAAASAGSGPVSRMGFSPSSQADQDATPPED
jgi:poly(A) polymerase